MITPHNVPHENELQDKEIRAASGDLHCVGGGFNFFPLCSMFHPNQNKKNVRTIRTSSVLGERQKKTLPTSLVQFCVNVWQNTRSSGDFPAWWPVVCPGEKNPRASGQK